MKKDRINIVLLNALKCVFTFVLCCVVCTGCISEDLSDCSNSYYFTVRAYDVDGAELINPPVNDIILYLFDKDGLFIEQINTQLNTRVEVKSDKNELYAVAWGNLGGGHETKPSFQPNDNISTGIVKLNVNEATAVAGSPDDLFSGNVSASRPEQMDKVVPIYRKTGSMNITILHLKEYLGVTDDDFTIQVGDTYSAIDFFGKYSGTKVSYLPTGSFVPNPQPGGGSQYYTPIFNLIPETKGVYIKIYHKNDLVATVTTYNGGSPIAVKEGLLTNVLIDFRGILYISATMTPWGDKYIWKSF